MVVEGRPVMRKSTLALIALLAAGFVSCGGARQGPTTVLVVRHAEKASDADDSPLTEAGVRRSQALARAAEGAGVSAIYSSQFRRNLETARPLAERLGVRITEAPVNLENPGDYGKALAREILERHAGEAVLVVGHANTVAATVEGLTGRAAPPGDVQYGDLYIVSRAPSGEARLVKAQFGF
jgi:broad specificity phosphatase PhoE